MPNLTSVGIASGVPNSGTGTVSTIDALIGTAGTGTANVQTVQGNASGTPIPIAISSTALDKGTGTGGSATQRVIVDSSQLATLGQAAMAASQPVVIANNQSAVPVSGTVAVTNTPLTNFGAGEYETVAASQTAQILGPTGATGDYVSGLLVVPATTSPGNVLLLDNATSITVFTGGATSVTNLVPFFIPLGMISVSGPWKITTGANVSVIGIGNFT